MEGDNKTRISSRDEYDSTKALGKWNYMPKMLYNLWGEDNQSLGKLVRVVYQARITLIGGLVNIAMPSSKSRLKPGRTVISSLLEQVTLKCSEEA